MNTLELWLCGARAIQFASCLLLLGIWAFDRLMLRATSVALTPPAEIFGNWQVWTRRGTFAALAGAGMSGVVWLALVAMDMSGLPAHEALRLPVLKIVWNDTHFGQLSKMRVATWCAVLLVALAMPAGSAVRNNRHLRAWLLLILSAALTASLAWAGHGTLDGPWHLACDAIHLLVVGVWPMGLAPLMWLLAAFRGAEVPREKIVRTVQRFSNISLGSAGLVASTGVINSWYVLGAIPHLWTTSYGHVLLLKLTLFACLVVVGAINRFRLLPRAGPWREGRFEWLRMNIFVELTLTSAVIVVVAILGQMPPAGQPASAG